MAIRLRRRRPVRAHGCLPTRASHRIKQFTRSHDPACCQCRLTEDVTNEEDLQLPRLCHGARVGTGCFSLRSRVSDIGTSWLPISFSHALPPFVGSDLRVSPDRSLLEEIFPCGFQCYGIQEMMPPIVTIDGKDAGADAQQSIQQEYK